MKRIKRRVFTPDWKDIPVTMSHDDFIRVCNVVECLCRISSLKELHEIYDILFHVSMENYYDYTIHALKEMHEIIG